MYEHRQVENLNTVEQIESKLMNIYHKWIKLPQKETCKIYPEKGWYNKSELTAPQVQQLETFCSGWAAFRGQSAPTMSAHYRSPGHQEMEFLSSSGRSDKWPEIEKYTFGSRNKKAWSKSSYYRTYQLPLDCKYEFFQLTNRMHTYMHLKISILSKDRQIIVFMKC